MTDRELLQELFDFMSKRNYVVGDEQSVRDMVLRYKQPPLTLYHRVCMQMTVTDYARLEDLLGRILNHFEPDNIPALDDVTHGESIGNVTLGNGRDSAAGNLSPDSYAE